MYASNRHALAGGDWRRLSRVVSGNNVRTAAAWIVPVEEGAPTEADLDLVVVAVEWQAVGAVEAWWRFVAEPRALGQEEAVDEQLEH
eukprot:scaffold4235_cov114-Isochrysis_galbana.AAC.2